MAIDSQVEEDKTEVRSQRLALEDLGFEVLKSSLRSSQKPELFGNIRQLLINLVPKQERLLRRAGHQRTNDGVLLNNVPWIDCQ